MFDSAQSFVIKVWLEQQRAGGEGGARSRGRRRWRGQITQLPGNHSRAVRRLDEITETIAAALEHSGADPGWRWRWRRRWQAWLGRGRP
ncbi:hypothetical protein [Deinococcus budaensis]|uniref:Uncharacterized protein n=1 Tax=Deinococcus budaensis TaxID=1665626 RepID=A0A7W8GIR0_9DEIO|nr:hypothetical protein [Deinococcus budaensis]MBB5235891.1 hypothetical protein [Deinococcus budaensis]